MMTKMPEIQPEIYILNELAIHCRERLERTYHRRYQQYLGDERASLAYV